MNCCEMEPIRHIIIRYLEGLRDGKFVIMLRTQIARVMV